ncbi:hypothetical protein [Frankia sp. AgB32]|uniref:hypothetical protein n=1 Tax=Frankia sp. AgB32 TaxID=631119 RepID=UPI00200E9586|nr:hypothetical protein [Frankia sp. AgB32]MCK9897878.1 hypothetical protein [Frankia sp. AgB32]
MRKSWASATLAACAVRADINVLATRISTQPNSSPTPIAADTASRQARRPDREIGAGSSSR